MGAGLSRLECDRAVAGGGARGDVGGDGRRSGTRRACTPRGARPRGWWRRRAGRWRRRWGANRPRLSSPPAPPRRRGCSAGCRRAATSWWTRPRMTRSGRRRGCRPGRAPRRSGAHARDGARQQRDRDHHADRRRRSADSGRSAAPGPTGLLLDVTQAVGRMPFSLRLERGGFRHSVGPQAGRPQGGRRAHRARGRRHLARWPSAAGRRWAGGPGTENVIGIAGFGAAAEAAERDWTTGVWDRVADLRNILEKRIAESGKETIFVGKDADRLPNTSCFVTPGWKGETQVMVMDLAGFAISAGSACSSGKVRASRVLKAMGYDEALAGSAIRVSLGPARRPRTRCCGSPRSWRQENAKRRAGPVTRPGTMPQIGERKGRTDMGRCTDDADRASDGVEQDTVDAVKSLGDATSTAGKPTSRWTIAPKG